MPREDHDELKSDLRDALDKRLAAPSAPQGGPPEGWRVVPDLPHALERLVSGHAWYQERVMLRGGVIKGRRSDTLPPTWVVCDPDLAATLWLVGAASPPHGERPEPASPHQGSAAEEHPLVDPACEHCESQTCIGRDYPNRCPSRLPADAQASLMGQVFADLNGGKR